MRFPIRLKLLSAFGLILLLAVGLVLFAYVLTDQYIRSQRISILADKAQTVADTLQDYLLDLEQEYSNLAIQYRSDADNRSAAFPILAMHQIKSHTATKQLVVLSTSGRELDKYDKNGRAGEEQLSVELPSQALTAAKQGDIGISKTYFVPGATYPQIDVYVPVVNNQARVIAIIKGQVALQNLQEVLSRLNLGRNGFAYIIDTEGQLIAHPHYSKLVNSNTVSQRSVIQKLVKGSYTDLKPEDHYYINENNVPVVSSSNRLTTLGWIAAVEQPESEVFDQLYFIRNILLGLLGVVLFVLLSLGYALSNQLANPIAQLQRRTKALQQGDTVEHLNIRTGDELEALATSFNTMADNLRQRESSLEQSNRTLELERDRQLTLLQSLTDGVFAVDASDKIILFNRAAETITGINSAQAIGRPVNEVIKLYRDETLLTLAEYSNQDEEFKLRLRQQGLSTHKDKVVVPISITAAPVTRDDGQASGWIISFRDITKEHEFEVMKLDFVSMAAHELRTPLTALRGYLSILLEESRKDLSKSSQTFLDRSLISANQLSSLVENLLNVSRIERGALKVELAPVQLTAIITDALTNLVEVARQKQITVTFDPPAKAPPLIMADQFRLAEVITNLVANGINYTKSGGRVKVSVKQEGQTLVTSVTDNGEGIPAASITHLFTKFYRVQASLAQGSKGTGLGLFISKAIVMAHQGKIWVESVEGKGSTFSFSIPLAPAVQQADAVKT